MHVHKSKEPAYMLIFLPCCPNLSNEALYAVAWVSFPSSGFTNPSMYMTVFWASQVHLVLVGITFVGVLYHGIVIIDLGAATKPGVPYVC